MRVGVLIRRSGVVAALTALVVMVAGCGVNLGVEGVSAHWDDVEGQDGRKVLVVTPDEYDPDEAPEPLPLVVHLHGLGKSAEVMATTAEWPEAVRDNNLLMAFGEGVERSWNAGACCEPAQGEVDDVAYIDAVIDQMVEEYGADPDQVFLAGYSNGGMMAYRYACERPDRLAGASSLAGTNYAGCDPTGATPFLQISGMEDNIIPPLGGKSAVSSVGEVPSVPVSVTNVAEGAGCASNELQRLEGLERLSWTGCRDGSVVRYDLVHGLDHRYPTDITFPGYVATEQILDFWDLSDRGSA